MAPKKEKKDKVEKVSAGGQEDMVFEYLRKQNRPYSATDISANLHNKVTKSAAQKILLKLQEAKKIEGRVSGKQSVYHTIQSPDDAPTPEALAEMDSETLNLCEETAAINADIKALRAELSQLNSSLSTADLKSAVASLEEEKTNIMSHLESLRSGSVKPVSKEEKEKVDRDSRVVERCVLARRKIVKEMWGAIAECVGDKSAVADIKEDLGIEI